MHKQAHTVINEAFIQHFLRLLQVVYYCRLPWNTINKKLSCVLGKWISGQYWELATKKENTRIRYSEIFTINNSFPSDSEIPKMVVAKRVIFTWHLKQILCNVFIIKMVHFLVGKRISYNRSTNIWRLCRRGKKKTIKVFQLHSRSQASRTHV